MIVIVIKIFLYLIECFFFTIVLAKMDMWSNKSIDQ